MSIERQEERDHEHEGRLAYALTDPIEPAKLAGEIGNGKKGAPPSFVVEGDPTTASEQSPVIVWVPEGLSERSLTNALKKHKHDTPSPLEALLRKARDDEAFTPEDLEHAVKALLIQRYGT